MPFFGGSKSSSTSYSTEQGAQGGDDSINFTISSGGNTISSDTPATLRYLTDKIADVAGDILDSTEAAAAGVNSVTMDANRRAGDTAAQLNLSLSEGLKELNLRATETKAENTTARNILIAVAVVAAAAFFFLSKRSKNVLIPPRRSK